jgi:ribonuclease P protein component
MSIPKKVVRQAAKRNRIKRCLREYFRLHQEEFSGDIVIRWHKAPKTMSYQNLALALEILRKHLRGI